MFSGGAQPVHQSSAVPCPLNEGEHAEMDGHPTLHDRKRQQRAVNDWERARMNAMRDGEATRRRQAEQADRARNKQRRNEHRDPEQEALRQFDIDTEAAIRQSRMEAENRARELAVAKRKAKTRRIKSAASAKYHADDKAELQAALATIRADEATERAVQHRLWAMRNEAADAENDQWRRKPKPAPSRKSHIFVDEEAERELKPKHKGSKIRQEELEEVMLLQAKLRAAEADARMM